jgi:hypothetical protein
MKSTIPQSMIRVGWVFAALFLVGCQTTPTEFWNSLGGEGYQTKDKTLDSALRPKPPERPWWDRAWSKKAQEIDDHLGQ